MKLVANQQNGPSVRHRPLTVERLLLLAHVVAFGQLHHLLNGFGGEGVFLHSLQDRLVHLGDGDLSYNETLTAHSKTP
jgi:hypothetical protein